MLDVPECFEVGAVILEKLVEVDPSIRQTLLQLVYGIGSIPYPRLMDLIVDAIIPSENEAINDPWHGLQEQSFNIPTGEMILFETLLRSHPCDL